MIYIVYDTTTGEIEEDCGICGIISGAHEEDTAVMDLPGSHGYKLVPIELENKIHQLDKQGKKYKHKVNQKTKNLEDTDEQI